MPLKIKTVGANAQIRPRKIVLYGMPGVGKSYWSTRCPRPFIFDVEDGLGDLTGFSATEEPVKSYIEMIEQLTEFGRSKECMASYDTVVIDSIDWLEKLIWAHHINVYNASAKNNVSSIVDIPFYAGYTQCEVYWERLFYLLTLLWRRGKHIVILAHFNEEKITPPGEPTYTKYDIAIQKLAAKKLRQWATEIMFISEDVYIDQQPGRKYGHAVGDGSVSIQCGPSNKAVTKRRLSNLPDKLSRNAEEFWEYFDEAKRLGIEELSEPSEEQADGETAELEVKSVDGMPY